jgi:hypothetical protein
VTQQDLGLYEGPIRTMTTELPAPELFLSWKGGKLSRKLWTQFKSFMRYGYEEFSSEVQVWFYYHPDQAIWQIAVPPQEIRTGMISKVLTHHADFEQALQFVAPGDGWCEHGTGHQHCNTSAFMSGIDKDDEQKKIGLHITLGGMAQEIFDIDSRAGLRGLIYQIELPEWVDGTDDPDFLSAVPIDQFPAYWTEFLHEPVPYVPPKFTSNWHTYHGSLFNPTITDHVLTDGMDDSEFRQYLDSFQLTGEDGTPVPEEELDLSNNWTIVKGDPNDEALIGGIELATYLESLGFNDWDTIDYEAFLAAVAEVLTYLPQALPEDISGQVLDEAVRAFGYQGMPDSMCLLDLEAAIADGTVVLTDTIENPPEEEHEQSRDSTSALPVPTGYRQSSGVHLLGP